MAFSLSRHILPTSVDLYPVPDVKLHEFADKFGDMHNVLDSDGVPEIPAHLRANLALNIGWDQGSFEHREG